VKAAQRAIPKIHAKRDDEAALQRAANTGNDLARAYAATLLLAKSGKVPVVADIRLGTENVPYVSRGKTKPFFLAGVQHHEDRALRLLSVASWARKRGMNFYSADRGIICTGKRQAPPADFIAQEAALLGLSKQEDVFTCGHAGDGIRIQWSGLAVIFRRCGSCAQDGSTLQALLRHIAGPKPSRHFDARADLLPLEARAGTLPHIDPRVPEAIMLAYQSGSLPDHLFLEAARAARVDALRQSGAHYVAGNVSFGDDVNAFVHALGASPDEDRAIRAALDAHQGAVVLDRPTVARAVGELWPQHGLRMLTAVSDDATAAKFHKEKPAADEAVELVRKAARTGSGRVAGLPTYGALPPAAAAADAIARAFRGQGREAAVRLAQEKANLPKAKGVSLAMLTALQAAQGQDWRFSHSDQDVAQSIAIHIGDLLRGSAERYHEALVATSHACGETADVVPR
jgi:hypothetical protein